MSKEFVFILQHSYLFEKNNKYGITPGYEEVKFIGVYSTRKKAEEAIERYCVKDGFDQYDKSCFSIDKYDVGKDTGWTNGFEKAGDNYWLPIGRETIEFSAIKDDHNICTGPGSEFHKVYLWQKNKLEGE